MSRLYHSFDGIGTSIKYAYLPTPMIKPVSLLEDLSNFLVFVNLLYPKEFAHSAGVRNSYEQFDTENRLFSVLKYFLSVWSTFSTVCVSQLHHGRRMCIFPAPPTVARRLPAS